MFSSAKIGVPQAIVPTKGTFLVLGDGALKKISKGAPIGLEAAIKIMAAVCNEVVSQYSEGLNEKYDIFPEEEEE